MSKFITNHDTKDLASRLSDLIRASEELKFLVGFFYFSGWRELYEPLKEAFQDNPRLKLKILVGLNVDDFSGRLLEVDDAYRGNRRKRSRDFAQAIRRALADPRLDVPEFPEQARFFLNLLEQGWLELKKTKDPNHAKLYLFKPKGDQGVFLGGPGKFITGSSNLTHAGLRGQHEFNVEIGDYGFEEAEQYFDELWQSATRLTKDDQALLRKIIERESLAALPTPFEVYALLLRRYLDILDSIPERLSPKEYIEKAGYLPLSYQLDAVEQILNIIDEYGGAILADVVGLGKTVVASLVAREYGRRGIVIAPPGLIGNPSEYGWTKYLEDFDLWGWRAFSTGKLEDALAYLQGPGKDIDLVIVDEAHRFRNPDTEAYALLQAITAGRKVLLLTATPYNNAPMDMFALLRLFVTPGSSRIGPTNDLERYFRDLNAEVKDYSYILRYHKSRDMRKRLRAERKYRDRLGLEPPVQESLVYQVMESAANRVRQVVAPVTVRRNRLDLEKNPRYRNERPDFSRLRDPEPLFYELTPEQSAFYDRVIGEWFGENSSFHGAIYQPALYQQGLVQELSDIDDEDSDTTFVVESQRNLASFMRRLLVQRFESSFGAFTSTLERLTDVHVKTLDFARRTGYFLLRPKTLERLTESMDQLEDPAELEDELEELLREDHEAFQRGEQARNFVYRLDDFADRGLFLKHIEDDLALLVHVYRESAQLQLANPQEDPKARALARFLKERLEQEPKRKFVVFSEFTDTVEHLATHLKASGLRVLAVGKSFGNKLAKTVVLNFDASVPKDKQRDDYDILVTSDKLSEGVNLHRAGAIVNYDIPWNPTRVIQRIGRINRIGHKIFDEIFVFHFFPTEKGRQITNPAKIAEHKLYLIHKALGEDTKIFSPDEEPTPASIYQRLTHLPQEEESFDTWARLEWERITNLESGLLERISGFPNRVKTARPHDSRQVFVVARKGLGFFAYRQQQGDDEPQPVSFQDALHELRAEPDTPRLEPSPWFWQSYHELEKRIEDTTVGHYPANSLEQKAIHNLNTALRYYREHDDRERIDFITRLLEDIRRYKRIPRYVLRRITRINLNDTNDERMTSFTQLLDDIQTRFGAIVAASPRISETPELVVSEEFQKTTTGHDQPFEA